MESLVSLFEGNLGLNKNHFEIFLTELKTKKLNKKEHWILEGSICKFIGWVSSGTLRSYIQTNEGEFNNDFYFDNDFVSAYTSFLTRMPTNCNIEALTESTIHYISYEGLERLITKDIAFLKLGKYISDIYFIKKCRRETSFLKYSAQKRFEDLLSTYPGIEQKVSQYHIASYLGIKAESLSRIKLSANGNKHRDL